MKSAIDKMVDRFLCWKLPADFGPDCGISFDGRGRDAMGHEKTWPIGTNLLTAEQAKAMLLHVTEPMQLEIDRLIEQGANMLGIADERNALKAEIDKLKNVLG